MTPEERMGVRLAAQFLRDRAIAAATQLKFSVQSLEDAHRQLGGLDALKDAAKALDEWAQT